MPVLRRLRDFYLFCWWFSSKNVLWTETTPPNQLDRLGWRIQFTAWPRHKGRGASIMLAVFFFFFPFNPSKYQIQTMVPSTVKKVSFLYAIPFWKVLLHILRHASVYLNCKFSQLNKIKYHRIHSFLPLIIIFIPNFPFSTFLFSWRNAVRTRSHEFG